MPCVGGGSGETYLDLLAKIRDLVPDVFLRSTFIVGFPGEEEKHFQHLLEFVDRARLDHLGAFAYSPEDETPAAEMKGRVPRTLIRSRSGEILERQRPISLESRERMVGKRVEVLIEGPCEETEHLLEGRHYGMAPEIDGRLLINDGLAPVGEMVEVEITEAFPDDLVGRIVGPPCVAGVRIAGE